jgi:hypothetical protein
VDRRRFNEPIPHYRILYSNNTVSLPYAQRYNARYLIDAFHRCTTLYPRPVALIRVIPKQR